MTKEYNKITEELMNENKKVEEKEEEISKLNEEIEGLKKQIKNNDKTMNSMTAKRQEGAELQLKYVLLESELRQLKLESGKKVILLVKYRNNILTLLCNCIFNACYIT